MNKIKRLSFFLLLLLVVILAIYAFYLIIQIKRSGSGDFKIIEHSQRDVVEGDSILQVVEAVPSVPFNTSILSLATLKGYRSYTGNTGTQMVDLELAVIEEGIEKSFFVTLVEEVNYNIYRFSDGKTISEVKGLTKVSELEYIKGERLNIIVGYFGSEDGDGNNIEKMKKYCAFKNSDGCQYLSLGFGSDTLNENSFSLATIKSGDRFNPSQIAVLGLSRNLAYSAPAE